MLLNRTRTLLPMLPSRAEEPFDSPDWLFELRWGGVRALASIDGGRVELSGQNGADLTDAYPELQALACQLSAHSAVLDGEIVAFGPAGYPDLTRLRSRLNRLVRPQAAGLLDQPLPRGRSFTYQVSDLLLIDGESLLDRPLWQRKNLLHARLRPTALAWACDFVEEEGNAFFDAVCEHRLEGIIAKHKYSVYRPGRRSGSWLEIPAMAVGQFVIGGYTFGGQKKAPFDSLLLGAYQGRDLVYAGRAGAALSNPEGWRTERLLQGLHTPCCPFRNPPAVQQFSYWCRPTLVCQARIGERAPDGTLRFAVFIALRPDISPRDCVVEAAR